MSTKHGDEAFFRNNDLDYTHKRIFVERRQYRNTCRNKAILPRLWLISIEITLGIFRRVFQRYLIS